MAAGRLSGDKVELGLAPIGSIGMGVFAVLLSQSAHSFALAAINLTMVGFFGGLFAVPLNALLQQQSGDEEKGRLMATNNFLNMVGDHAARPAALWLCARHPRADGRSDHPRLRRPDARRQRLRAQRRAGVPRALLVSGC